MSGPVLSGPRLDLVACDLPLVEMILNDKPALANALKATVPDDWPVSLKFQSLYRDILSDDPNAVGWLGYLAVLRSERIVVGDIGFHCPLYGEGSVEIGYSVSTAQRGNGFATEMLGILMDWAYSDPRLHRVTAHTDPRNISSIRVLEKNGFRLAGTAVFRDKSEKLFWVLDRLDFRWPKGSRA
jgi:RimJ/RimL family protein N-acetyltransferase